MIALDEDAFICDMAETYQIYDYRQVPGRLLGTLASGLRDDSRIKMKASGVKADANTLLLAHVLDCVQWLVWSKTKDAEHNNNRPKSVAARFYEKKAVDHSRDLTPNEYENIRNKILKGKNNG